MGMPTVHVINSIKIDIYLREHLPSHFHSIYAEHEILRKIKTLGTYKGYLPSSQPKMVLKWAAKQGIQNYLMDIYLKLNPHLRYNEKDN